MAAKRVIACNQPLCTYWDDCKYDRNQSACRKDIVSEFDELDEIEGVD